MHQQTNKKSPEKTTHIAERVARCKWLLLFFLQCHHAQIIVPTYFEPSAHCKKKLRISSNWTNFLLVNFENKYISLPKFKRWNYIQSVSDRSFQLYYNKLTSSLATVPCIGQNVNQIVDRSITGVQVIK